MSGTASCRHGQIWTWCGARVSGCSTTSATAAVGGVARRVEGVGGDTVRTSGPVRFVFGSGASRGGVAILIMIVLTTHRGGRWMIADTHTRRFKLRPIGTLQHRLKASCTDPRHLISECGQLYFAIRARRTEVMQTLFAGMSTARQTKSTFATVANRLLHRTIAAAAPVCCRHRTVRDGEMGGGGGGGGRGGDGRAPLTMDRSGGDRNGGGVIGSGGRNTVAIVVDIIRSDVDCRTIRCAGRSQTTRHFNSC